VHCANAILPISVINDGLDKWTEWPESEALDSIAKLGTRTPQGN